MLTKEILSYGVARLAIIPVRKNPSHQSEQVTQLLFGDHYMVTIYDEERRWVCIVIHTDQYVGWIDIQQHHVIHQEYFDYINTVNYRITIDIISNILYERKMMNIVMGSTIPISRSELFEMEDNFSFTGNARTIDNHGDFELVKLILKKYIGSPYAWGGKTPFGIDCSGLVQMVFKICGYSLSRDASQQVEQGKKITTLADAFPGDLAFFEDKNGNVVHVGIVVEDKAIVHAHGKVRRDVLTQHGIYNVEKKEFTHTLSHLRRILSP